MFDKAKKETNLGKLFSKFDHNSTDHIRLFDKYLNQICLTKQRKRRI
jgi:hypothetical protein